MAHHMHKEMNNRVNHDFNVIQARKLLEKTKLSEPETKTCLNERLER